MHRHAANPHKLPEGSLRNPLFSKVFGQMHSPILTRGVVYPSRKNGGGLSSVTWKRAGLAADNAATPRKTAHQTIADPSQPHPFAYLGMWRESSGLTQENVAGTLGVTGVTLHRWETGKAPVTVSNYIKLASLYGANDISMLTLPPPRRDEAMALQEAWKIISDMPEQARQDWLATGRVLKQTAGTKS